MPAVSQALHSKEVPRINGALKHIDFNIWDPDGYTILNREKLEKEGIPEYNNLKGFKTDGIEVTEHKVVPESTLQLQRYGRIGATVGAVVLNTVAAVGLFYSGAKLFFSSFGLGDVEESYKGLGKAYSCSSVAGALTGAAHESPEWAIGNIGMGLFSRFLGNIWGLAGFSISEGLSAIGMGRVRYRDKRNVYAVKNSLFNNPKLSNFRFLIPIEQSILSFVEKLFSPSEWIRFRKEEPYSLFQTAGGGLISGGGLLAIASIFKNKLSDAVRSFFYIPYALFSVANLVAFYRDGEVQLWRAKKLGSRKAGETYSMRAEGYCKEIASPFLAVNNFLLALKGFGIDTGSGIMYNLAMAVRSWGAGIAFLSFKSQSLLKFFKPDLFGPKFKEIIKISLNPIKATNRILAFIEELEKKRPPLHISDKFDSIIFSGDNEQRDVMDALLKTKTFERLKGETQVGLPLPHNPPINGRPYLERFTHSKRVCAIGMLIYNALLKNTTDEELKKLLLENREAFKLSGLLHDIGHIARSHLAELAVKGHNNDEYTLKILEDSNSDINQTLNQHYGNKRGQAISKQASDIIGRLSPLYKAFKIADYIEYLRCGDFTAVQGFPKWTIDDIKEYVDTVRLCKDKNGKMKVAFTEKGAIETFITLFDRKVFNDSYNYNPIVNAEQSTYLLGLDAARLSSEEIKKMTEPQVDEAVRHGLTKLKGSNFQSRLRDVTGGENAYCGYSRFDPEKKIMVYIDEKAEPVEFLGYLEKVIKPRDKSLYNELLPKVKGLTIPRELDLTINVSSN